MIELECWGLGNGFLGWANSESTRNSKTGDKITITVHRSVRLSFPRLTILGDLFRGLFLEESNFNPAESRGSSSRPHRSDTCSSVAFVV